MIFTQILPGSKGKHTISAPGEYLFFIHNYSGTVEIDIKSEQVKAYIYGIYIGKKGDDFKLNTIQRHRVGNSVSDLLIKGVFFDDSRFVYEGLIRIEKKAQLSNAYQKNQNLVMDPTVFVDSRPYLEILANDVRCTHGSTTGKLDKELLYFAKTRGLTDQQAQDMLLEGFIADVYNRMKEIGYTMQPV